MLLLKLPKITQILLYRVGELRVALRGSPHGEPRSIACRARANDQFNLLTADATIALTSSAS